MICMANFNINKKENFPVKTIIRCSWRKLVGPDSMKDFRDVLKLARGQILTYAANTVLAAAFYFNSKLEMVFVQ
jgi:hypothetical protein